MELVAQKREITGKKVKNLREQGNVPAVIFGKSLESESILVGDIAFRDVFAEAGETALIDLKIGSQSTKVLVNEVQVNPINFKVTHISFYKPDLTQKTQVEVPVEYINEDDNDLVKSGDALVLLLMSEITVEALPSDLPHAFIIDVSKIKEVGDGITIDQLEYDKEKVELINVEPEDLVIKLDYAEMEEVEEETTMTPEEIEAAALAQMEVTEETADEDGEESETQKDK